MYDYVIVTHLPAFYKVNLYNELAKNMNIFVIFLSSNTRDKRSSDFVILDHLNFKYKILNNGDFQTRNTFQSIFKLKHILKNLEYKKILVSGWDLLEFWLIVLTTAKKKNCLALESTIMESNTQGIKGHIKKIFLLKIATVFASGNLHVELLKKLNYTGAIKITKGVGIINKPVVNKKTTIYQKRFLFIGRLSPEKNINVLINIFNDLPVHKLTIIGQGFQKSELQAIAKENIYFIDQVENKDLKDTFLKNDILILPSLSEPWGLVVEEALYFGLPAIVSKNCGVSELIVHGENGFIIDPNNPQNIKEIIFGIDEEKYHKITQGTSASFIKKKDLGQINAYNVCTPP